MKKLIFFCSLFYYNCLAQSGTWVWLTGDSTVSVGSYGTQGVPNATNQPGARYQAANWLDQQGNLWLFGGGFHKKYNDLWKYDATANMWIWMHGPQAQSNLAGNYGVQGIASPINNPGFNELGGVAWIDTNNNLWLYQSQASELWKYVITTNEWTWMNGVQNSNSVSYGIKGVASSSNRPPAVPEMKTTWIDKNTNTLYMFDKNDMWQYNIATNMWTWLQGTQGLSNAGNYGIKGVAATSNQPSTRYIYTHWQDDSSNLYFYGGLHVNAIGSFYMGDVWKFDIKTNLWTWIDGSQVPNYIDSNNQYCTFSNIHLPTAYYENRSAYNTCNDYVFLFGGGFYPVLFEELSNQLHAYNKKTNQWIWISGDGSSNQIGNWGNRGLPSITNKISSRLGMSAWLDTSGKFYVFGGFSSLVDNGNIVAKELNDLWLYTPDKNCLPQNFSDSIHKYVPSKTNICIGDSVVIKLDSTATWQIIPNANDALFYLSNTSATLMPNANTTYLLIGIKNIKCNTIIDTIKVTINVLPKPIAKFNITPLVPQNLEPMQLINTSSNASAYLWKLKNITIDTTENIVFKPNQFDEYCFTLIASNILGCADSTTNCITLVEVDSSYISIPNAFTPGTDYVNDVLYINAKNVKVLQFQIFNRWGQKVFATTKASDGWDGRQNGKNCDTGTYQYFVKYVTKFGEKKILKGDVILIR